MKSLMSPLPHVRVKRKLLLAAILAPLFIYWVQTFGVKQGFWNANFGVLTGVFSNVIFFSWIAFHTSARFEKSDAARSLAVRREFEEAHPRQVTQKWLDLIAAAVPDFISYVDLNERYRFANSAYGSWFGTNPEEIIGQSTRDILGADYADAQDPIKRALAGETVKHQNCIIASHGIMRYYEVDYIPDFSAQGEVRGFMIIGHDTSKSVQTEVELARAVKAPMNEQLDPESRQNL
ncbi:MAG: PAS domain-containing protein [Bdellovibrionales bacterium]|nr:PAS domain-containing protein [Oligoflexia bacterium]